MKKKITFYDHKYNLKNVILNICLCVKHREKLFGDFTSF